MKNGIIKETKNSRLIKSDVPATYEEFKALLADSGLPIDLLFNADGWSTLPTLLGRGTLFSAQSEIKLFGQDGDHTVDEAIAELIPKVGDVLVSKRQDVGDKYLLCNGDELSVDLKEYAELIKLLPKSHGTPRGSSLPNGTGFYIDDTTVYAGYYYVLVRNSRDQFKVYRSKDIKNWEVTKVGTSTYNFSGKGGLLITDDYISVFTDCNIPTDKGGKVFYVPYKNFTTATWKASSYTAGFAVSSKPVYALGKYIFFPMYADTPAGPWAKIPSDSYIPAGWSGDTLEFGGCADSKYLYIGLYDQLRDPPHRKAIVRTKDLTVFETFNISDAFNDFNQNTSFTVMNGKIFLLPGGVFTIDTNALVNNVMPVTVVEYGVVSAGPKTQIEYIPETEEYSYIGHNVTSVLLFKLDGAYREFKVGKSNLVSYGKAFHTENLFLSAPANGAPANVFALDVSEVANLPKISISDVYAYIRAKE